MVSTLREAVLNLVLNALDAQPNGGAIRLVAERKGSNVELSVADTGVSIAPEVQSRIFEPFFTTKGERESGLGLAMVHSIVERHGGTTSVSGRPGEGTTFTLQFPAEGAANVVEGVPTAIMQARELPNLRVLAVDDEAPLAQLVAALLRLRGHRVVTANSGEEALDLIRNQPFDLVLSDLGMGAGMTGWELATEVRALHPDIAFVLATGWGAEIDPQEARGRGVDAVLAKPFRGAQLERLIESLHHDGVVRLDTSDAKSAPVVATSA